jgi:hypothetical protein
MRQHPSNSIVQRNLEKEIIKQVSTDNPEWVLVDWGEITAGMKLPSRVEPDAVWRVGEKEIIIAECYAHIGGYKSGQRRKIAKDILKLLFLYEDFIKLYKTTLMLIVSHDLGSRLEGNNWLALVIKKKDIKLYKISLSEDQRNKLQGAAKYQANGQARIVKNRK